MAVTETTFRFRMKGFGYPATAISFILLMLDISLLPTIFGSVVALGFLVAAMNRHRGKRLIDDLPTSKAQGVFIGLVELHGTAESESPFTSYLAGIPCVQYSWRIEEQSTETRIETYRDSKGHTQVRTVRTTKWTTVASGGDSAPFYLKDDTGLIRIVPDRANLENKTVIEDTVGRSDPRYFGKGPEREVPHTDHRRRLRESAIPLHAMLCVIGQARERQDTVAAEIAYDKQAPMFLVSTRSEKQVSTSHGVWSWMFALTGFVAAVGGVALSQIVRQEVSPFRLSPLFIAASLFFLALLLGWVWTAYNSLVNLRQRVRQAWSEVDVQLNRRKALIPNLVQAVEGYKEHEQEVQALVAGLRGQLAATPPGVAGPDYAGCAATIKLVVERYPELKASALFLKLQGELSDTEQRIALARDYFNGIAAFYNIRLLIVPDRFVAALARLRQQPLLAASDFERAEVNVDLAQ